MTQKPIKKEDKAAQSEPRKLNLIELALLGLSGVCDGAHSHDKQGFNGTDTKFGKSLAEQIEKGFPLTYKQATKAMKILPKYAKQLKAMGLAVPYTEDFDAAYKYPYRIELIDGEVAIFMPYADRVSILNQHPSGRFEGSDRSYRFPLSDAKKIRDGNIPPEFRLSDEFVEAAAALDVPPVEVLPALRVDLLTDAEPDEQIAVYAPYDHIPTMLAIVNLKAHFVSDDRSWRFPLSLLPEVIEAFPEENYHYSEAFKKAAVRNKPRVDLILDEHPDRCIAVVGSSVDDVHFDRKVSDLGGIYNESDNTWRFSLKVVGLILCYFPSTDYSHSESLLDEFKPIQCGF